MTDDGKRDVDALLALSERAWNQYNERRAYYVKFQFAFWTALALATAGSFTITSLPAIPYGRLVLSLVAALAVALHFMALNGIRNANRLDRIRAVDYQNRVHDIIGFKYPESTAQALARGDRTERSIRHWGNITVLVTFFLAVALVAANWNRFPSHTTHALDPAAAIQASRDSVALAIDRLRLVLLRADSAGATSAPGTRQARP